MSDENEHKGISRACLFVKTHLFFLNFKCVHFIVFKLFHNKDKEEEKRAFGIFRVIGRGGRRGN